MSRFQVKSAFLWFIVVEMKKKFILLLLAILISFSFSSCDSAESGLVVNQPVKVAVAANSLDYLAAYDYTVDKGYELLEFDSRQAAIVAVENGKADYVVINSNDATEKLLESVSLSFVENTQYSVDYCAVFRKDSTALQKQFNSAITQLKTDGVFDKINKSYRAGESYSSDNVTLNDGKITVLCCPVFDSLLCFDESGNVKGKELDFISEMCNALSLEAELMIITEYDEMFTALNEGEGDVIISAVEHTAELEADYLLSDVYNQTTFGVYKRK